MPDMDWYPVFKGFREMGMESFKGKTDAELKQMARRVWLEDTIILIFAGIIFMLVILASVIR